MRLLAPLVLSLSMMTGAEPPPAVAAAAQRRAWVWFGTTEIAARERATAAGQAFAVVWRDGTATTDLGSGAGVHVAVLGGAVIEARDRTTVEGCREPALLPLLGQSEAAAVAEGQRLQRPVRVIWRDGSGLPATMDYLEERLNLHVADGIVVAISGG